MANPAEVEVFLRDLEDYAFWVFDHYPEVALLRARRFGDMHSEVREQVAQRLVRLPPSDFWLATTPEEDLEEARVYCAVLELKRIGVRGSELPADASAWLADNKGRFENLHGMSHDSGLPGGSRVMANASPVPEARYAELVGGPRLRALEDAWGNRNNWGTSGPASDWIRQPGNAFAVFRDLQASGDDRYEYPSVWERFCASHRPTRDEDANRKEAEAVLALIGALPQAFLRRYIHLPTSWMRAWGAVLSSIAGWSSAWLYVWPVAVDATNEDAPEWPGAIGNVVHGADGEGWDTRSTPVDDMLGAFRKACSLSSGPFTPGSDLRKARDQIEACSGHGIVGCQTETR